MIRKLDCRYFLRSLPTYTDVTFGLHKDFIKMSWCAHVPHLLLGISYIPRRGSQGAPCSQRMRGSCGDPSQALTVAPSLSHDAVSQFILGPGREKQVLVWSIPCLPGCTGQGLPPALHPSPEIQLRQDRRNRADLASHCRGGGMLASWPSVLDWGGTVPVPGPRQGCRDRAASLTAVSLRRAFDSMVTSMMVQVC